MYKVYSMLFSYEIEITSEVTGRAPIPELTIGVKQSGKLKNKHISSYLNTVGIKLYFVLGR